MSVAALAEELDLVLVDVSVEVLGLALVVELVEVLDLEPGSA